MTRILYCLFLLVRVDAAVPAETVRIEFRALRVGEAQMGPVQCHSGTEPVVFTPSRFLPAGPFTYHGPACMRFVPALDPETLFAEVRVPEGTGRALLFSSAHPAEGAPYRIDLVNDDPRAFPAGSLILLNCTDRELLARVAGSDVTLGRGPSRPFTNAAEHGGGPLVQLAVRTERGPRIVYENRIEFRACERAVLVLEPPQPSEPLRIRTCLYSERVPDSP